MFESVVPLPILIGAAVVDSINPCAIGVLIFLLAYLTKSAKKRHKMLLHGLAYILAVFLTYLLAGLLLLPLIGSLGQLSTTAYIVLGILVMLAGLLEIKDYFWYGKGPSLALIPGASQRIKFYASHISDSFVSAFTLGIFVALVELPCTGAVYLAVLSMMSLSGTSFGNISWLIIYNLIFVTPLIIILLFFVQGVSASAIEAWRKKHRKLMRLIIGVMLLLLGGWMLAYTLL